LATRARAGRHPALAGEAGARPGRSASSAWQPASSGVTEGRAISASAGAARRRLAPRFIGRRESPPARSLARTGAAAGCQRVVGRTSIVISVKLGRLGLGLLGAGTRDTGACSFCSRHSRLVGESA
jgi:hypothetical protein